MDALNDYYGEQPGLPNDDQLGGPNKCQALYNDDIVPSLPPDWKPPSFSTEEVQSSQESSSSEEVGIVM
jgi:hypothetical protein